MLLTKTANLLTAGFIYQGVLKIAVAKPTTETFSCKHLTGRNLHPTGPNAPPNNTLITIKITRTVIYGRRDSEKEPFFSEPFDPLQNYRKNSKAIQTSSVMIKMHYNFSNPSLLMVLTGLLNQNNSKSPRSFDSKL